MVKKNFLLLKDWGGEVLKRASHFHRGSCCCEFLKGKLNLLVSLSGPGSWLALLRGHPWPLLHPQVLSHLGLQERVFILLQFGRFPKVRHLGQCHPPSILPFFFLCLSPILVWWVPTEVWNSKREMGSNQQKCIRWAGPVAQAVTAPGS